jgi:hypothetical protein
MLGFDRERLDKAESANRLAELDILNARTSDLGKIRASELTAGQLIILADVVNAVRDLTSLPEPDADVPSAEDVRDYFAPPSSSERRGGFGTDETAAYRSAKAAYDSLTDEEKAELADRLRSIFSSKIPDDTSFDTVNGPVKFSDVPKGGEELSKWLDQNCTCDEHERKRERVVSAADSEPGMYL